MRIWEVTFLRNRSGYQCADKSSETIAARDFPTLCSLLGARIREHPGLAVTKVILTGNLTITSESYGD